MPKIGYQNFTFNRYEMYQEEPEYLLSANRGEIAAPNLGMEIVNTSQVFSDGGIPGGKIGPVIDSGNAGLSSMGTSDISVRIWAGADFENRSTAPFRVMRDGDVVANSITITGGTLNYGKTSFTDSTNAGYYISSEGIYIGDAGDASQLKYTIADGTFNFVGTVSSRSTLTIANAIDASGNLVTDIINSKLDSSSKTILSDFNFGATNYAGGVKSGDITWNTTTGAITGGSGVVVYRSGIVGATGGVTTFSIDATTGAAIFAGQITSTSGAIGGWTLGSDSLTASSGAVGLSSEVTAGNDIRFFAGNATPASAPFRVYEDGSVVMSSATIAGYKLFGAVVDAAGNGDYKTIQAALTAGKKNIFVRNGTYTLTADITVTASDVVITGESRDGVIITSGADNGDWQIKVTGHYVQLSDFSVDKQYGTKAAVLIEGNSAQLDNLLVETDPILAYGVYSSGAKTNMINCEINAGTYCVYSTGRNAFFVSNKITQPYGGTTAIVYLDGAYATFKDNYVGGEGTISVGLVQIMKNQAIIADNNIVGSGSGVGIWAESNFSNITGNRVYGTYNAMRIYRGDATIVSHNNLYNLTSVAVWLGNGTTDLENCSFINNVIRTAGGDGIRLGGVISCNINNNFLDGCTGQGIDHVAGDVFYCNINNNNIINGSSHGITARSASTYKYNNIVGNQINFNGGRGFNMSASYCNIVSNVSSGNTTSNDITNTSGNTQYTLT